MKMINRILVAGEGMDKFTRCSVQQQQRHQTTISYNISDFPDHQPAKIGNFCKCN
jgi:hypothetical protein